MVLYVQSACIQTSAHNSVLVSNIRVYIYILISVITGRSCSFLAVILSCYIVLMKYIFLKEVLHKNQTNEWLSIDRVQQLIELYMQND